MNVQSAGMYDAGPTGVSVRALPVQARFALRVGPAERAGLGEAIGVALPERIGARGAAGGLSALCLGPDEWVVVAEMERAAELEAVFAESAGRWTFSAVDVSHREIGLALDGAGVLDLLATGCPRDLARMPVGSGCRTVFDTVPVLLTREGEGVFHLVEWRSFAPHVRALLDVAVSEFAAGL